MTAGAVLPPLPVVRGHWAFGSILDLRDDPVGTLERGLRERGPNFRLDMKVRSVFVLGHPDSVQHVLTKNPDNYRYGSSVGHREIRRVVGDSVLTTDGAAWARLRRNQQPAFTAQRLLPFAEKIVDRARAALARWAGDQQPDVGLDSFAAFTGMTLQNGVDMLFDYQSSHEEAAVVTSSLLAAQNRLWTDLFRPLRLPARLNAKAAHDARVLHAFAARILGSWNARMSAGEDMEERAPLLHAISKLSGTGPAEIHSQVLTYVVSVAENPSNTLAWALTSVSQHPEIEARLRDEIEGVLGARAPTIEDLPKLEYTQRVIDETLRLYPSAWMLDRWSSNEDVVMGQRLPAGSGVLVSPYLVHRNPDFWPEPTRFDPDRFLPAAVEARPRHHYVPYGAGPHACIGARLARLELQLLLPLLLQRHRFEVASAVPVRPSVGFLLRPERLRFRVRPFQPGSDAIG